MSESAGIGGLNGASLGAFEARLQAAEMGRLDSQLAQISGAADRAQAKSATSKADAAETAKLTKVSKDFESIFLAYMLKTMRQTVPKEGLMEESQGEEIFSGMRDEELSKGMANAGGIGLSKLLVDQLKQSLKKPTL